MEINKYKSAVFDFLQQFRQINEEQTVNLRHISGCNYCIDNENDYKKFLNLYIDAIKNGVNDMSFIEQQNRDTPIIIDIDLEILKYESNKKYFGKRLYNDELIKNLCKKYVEVFNNIFEDIKNVEFIIFEKDNYIENNEKITDGFHVICKDIITNGKIRHLIRRKVVELCDDDELFDGYSKSTDKIIDRSIVSSNGWLLYGSKKPNVNYSYKLSYFLNSSNLDIKYYYSSKLNICKDGEHVKEIDNTERIKQLSLQFIKDIPKLKVKKEYKTECIDDFDKINDEYNEDFTNNYDKNESIKDRNKRLKDCIEKPEYLTDEIFDDILSHFPDEYFSDYNDWINLVSFTKTYDLDYNILDKHSQRGKKYINKDGRSCYNPTENLKLFKSNSFKINNRYLLNRLKEFDNEYYKVCLNKFFFNNDKKKLKQKEKLEKSLEIMENKLNIPKETIEEYKKRTTELIDNNFENNLSKDTLFTVKTEEEAGNIIYNLMKNDIKCCKLADYMAYYYKDNNIWINDEKLIKNKIIRKIATTNIIKENLKGEIDPFFGKNYTQCENIFKFVKTLIDENNIDNDFYNKLHETTKYKLVFNDGVLDIKNNNFFTWDNEEYFNKNPIYSIYKINRNFKDDYNKYINNDDETLKNIEYLETLIKSIVDNQSEKLLQFLSRASFGFVEDKDWSIFIGNRNCGKGVLCELIQNSLKDYVDTVNANSLLMERETSNDLRKLEFAIPFEFKRLMLTNEMNFDNSNKNLKINGVLLKSLFSGGDMLKGRKIFKSEMTFYIQSKMMILCNDLPPISTKDATETMIQFTATNQYKSKDEIDEIKRNIETRYNDKDDIFYKNDLYKNDINKYKLANPEIKNEIKQNINNCKNTFILLLLKYFCKDKIKIVNINNDDDNDDSIKTYIYTYLDFNKDDKKYKIKNSDLKTLSDNIGCSLKKLKIELYGLGAEDYRTASEKGLKNFKTNDKYNEKFKNQTINDLDC